MARTEVHSKLHVSLGERYGVGRAYGSNPPPLLEFSSNCLVMAAGVFRQVHVKNVSEKWNSLLS